MESKEDNHFLDKGSLTMVVATLITTTARLEANNGRMVSETTSSLTFKIRIPEEEAISPITKETKILTSTRTSETNSKFK
jgi:hypothetical protein